MSDKKHYAFFVRASLAYRWSIVSVDGVIRPLTLRDYVDISIGGWIKAGALLMVPFKEFIEDIKEGYEKSKYTKMLGWNYVTASRLVENEGTVFLLPSYFETRAYSFCQTRDDDQYALQLNRDIYGLRGGAVVWEEFDSSRHIVGSKPNVDI
jgi:hypothetical protein